jgi:hypothetical protein
MYEIIHSNKSLNAALSLEANQYCFVTIDPNGDIELVSTAGGYAVGVLQDKPLATSPGFICGPGDITKVRCGGVFAPGDPLTSDAFGQAVVAASGEPFLGIALGAGADTVVTNMLFQPQGFMAP